MELFDVSSRKWKRYYVDLENSYRWIPFLGVGKRHSTLEANLTVIVSIIFEFGRYSGPKDLGPGVGGVDIKEIKFVNKKNG